MDVHSEHEKAKLAALRQHAALRDKAKIVQGTYAVKNISMKRPRAMEVPATRVVRTFKGLRSRRRRELVSACACTTPIQGVVPVCSPGEQSRSNRSSGNRTEHLCDGEN